MLYELRGRVYSILLYRFSSRLIYDLKLQLFGNIEQLKILKKWVIVARFVTVQNEELIQLLHILQQLLMNIITEM
jgi:hypothetical protein